MRGYGIFTFFYIFLCKAFTFYISKSARLIRFPLFIKNKNQIDFGLGLTTGVGCRFDAFSKSGEKILIFGNNVEVNDYVHIGAIEKVQIGNNVLIASKVFIADHNHGCYSGENQCSPETLPGDRPISSSPVIIEDNVWLGEFVSVLPGVTIGKGCIIGCNSVVTKSIPPYCIAVGSPAKIIKKYSFERKQWLSI